MDLSLIIVTRNRCKQLARCLQSVARITFERPWELIIVDSSTDKTASVVQEFIKTAPVPVRYVFEPKSGIGNARNAGLEIARGGIVAFTDDDCYPAPDFLSSVWLAFEDQLIGYICGRIMLHDPEDYPLTINESNVPRTFPARSFIRAGEVMGANMAFRRKVLLDIGGFDPYVRAEDVDVAGRASAAGWEGRYRPEVVVSHHHGRKESDLPSLWKLYATGRGAYYIKLLLNGHFRWYLRALYEMRGRCRGESGKSIIWEQVGAARYARRWLTETVRRWFEAARG
jgi:glycosyltransferase involved in cell wall biosynthesis